MPVQVVVRLIGLTPRLGQRERQLQECDAEIMRPRRDRDAGFEIRIDSAVDFVVRRRLDHERRHLLAVEKHDQVVLLAQALDRV